MLYALLISSSLSVTPASAISLSDDEELEEEDEFDELEDESVDDVESLLVEDVEFEDDDVLESSLLDAESQFESDIAE